MGESVDDVVASSAPSQEVKPASAELGRPEHQEFRWVSFDRAQELLSGRFWPILQWARDVVAAGSV